MQISLKRLERNPDKILDTLNLTQTTKLVAHLDDAFHTDSEGLISDAVYDHIRRYIDTRWPKSKLARKVGARDDSDVKLPVPMASLDQYTFGGKQLSKALAEDVDWVLTDKLDGLSIELVYEKGVPVKAFTRGDATSGKDVSQHLPSMRIPQKIPEKGTVVLRCEALIPYKTFMAKLHESAGGRFKAARNAASGLVRNFETAKEFKYVHMVCFGIIGGKGATDKQSKQFARLERWGFEVVRHFGPMRFNSEDELIPWLDKRIAKAKYELDGVVMTRDIATPKATASNPKHAFKFKMNVESDTVVVTVKDVIYQESKYGVLAPVAIFPPTIMSGGVTVERASAHNGYYVEHGYLKPKGKGVLGPKRPLGIGAKVKLIRSGKVIPYIMEILKPAKLPTLPKVPYKINGVEFVAKTKSSAADARMLGSFLKGLDVANTGPSTCKLLIASGIKTPEQLFDASMGALREIVGDSRGRQLAKDLKALKAGVPMNTWLKATASLFMRGANTTFDKVVDAIPNLEYYLKRGYTADLTLKISGMHGIDKLGPAIAEAAVKSYEMAASMGVTLVAPKKVKVVSAKLKGINVAFTGIRDRDLMKRIVELGGTASDSMKSDTTILIAKDPGSGSAKLQKAIDKGIPVMGLAEFKSKYKLE
ncbi:NAD-dependent DNA ligase [Erwinia phage vB_EamM_Alexandra]|uniref:DNA ligase (NAD(+)) n=1 Tax=Erwinia phage vB_EamM_Alexandra TaxID=2201424 RepID=A0A2Z4QES3_9CAUD|nr:NAD-dependent DNA ligase [Erwinia phage vB_EamM_Alexandra]AWY08424.1 hypothetical protein Alexandra_152 [Erwinia phage vB_EamM_Alexandra]